MPKLNKADITYQTNIDTFLTMEQTKQLSNEIKSIQESLTNVKEKLELELVEGSGFDLYSFVIEGEPIVYKAIKKQIENMEEIIQDLQYETWRIFERGKWHRTRELEIYIEVLDEEIDNHPKPKAVNPPKPRHAYRGETPTQDYLNDSEAYRNYREANQKWKDIMYGKTFGEDGLLDKKEKAKKYLIETEKESYAANNFNTYESTANLRNFDRRSMM